MDWRDWKGLSADYALYHRHPLNRLCHALGIPLIVFCAVRWTQFPGTALPAAAAVIPLYVFWHPALGLGMAGVIVLMAAAAAALPAWIFGPLFAAGWALQLLGHKKFEGRSPAFTQNLLHLFVGPLWLLREGAAIVLALEKKGSML